MNVFKRAWKWVKAVYESSRTNWNGERSYIISAVQDARFDIDTATRTEILRKSRYFEQNNGIVQRLVDLFEQFTVGANGILMIPNSSDEKWNQAASEYWNEWSRFPDLVTKQPLSVLQSLLARSWFVDGEIFIHKTQSPQTNRPRIELIESHRVLTPPSKRENEGKTIIDGVEVDGKGRPIGYYVKDGPEDEDWILIKADMMVHLFEPCRAGQYRGLPMTYAVLNDIHDLDDLQKLGMKKAKDAASITNVLTNAPGEAASPGTLRRMAMNIGTQTSAGVPITKRDDQYYENLLGARTVALRTGEKMEQFRADYPSVADREFWDYMLGKICAGVGISRLLVFPYSMQGTVTRADLDVSAVFFRSRSKVIETAIREIFIWVIRFANQFDDRLANAPANWFKATARPPRSPNVDVGRNSAAMLAELEAGTRTYEEVYGELGEDWRERLRQKAEERAYIHKLATEFTLSIDEIAAMAVPQDPENQPKETEPATA